MSCLEKNSSMQKILNKKNIKHIDTKTMVYIGRPFGDSQQHFGNPFSHLSNSKASVILKTRNESIKAFEDWLNGNKYQEVESKRRLWVLNNLSVLKDRDLVCWCSPLSCHGDVYLKLLKEKYGTLES